MPVSNNPYNMDCKFGINHPSMFIPFLTKGSMVYFESHVPSDEELDNCVHVCLMDQEEWDPTNVMMDLHRPELLDVNQVTIIPDDYECELDLVLGDISTSYVKKKSCQG